MYEDLIKQASMVLNNSYSPYSGVKVASAILCGDGRVYLGVNVENSSYGLTICAERSAVSAMITGGGRRPIAVAIVTDLDEPILPCGACRQVLSEFNPDVTIVAHSVRSKKTVVYKLSDLLPQPFKLSKLSP